MSLDETDVGQLGKELRPVDNDGAFFKALEAAVGECAMLGQLSAFQPVFTQAKRSYWRAWERARHAFSLPERPDWTSPEFSALTRDIGEIEDLLPALVTRSPKEAVEMTNIVSDIEAPLASLDQRGVAELHSPVDEVNIDASIEEVQELLPRLAASNGSVLILGETGVGKEFYAREIHGRSTRSDKPFIPVNCATLPKERIDSELYGHTKGAFTGADRDKKGRVRDAEHGTLFLDELGALPAECWGNLLRFLQDREISPVGGEASRVDVRIIAATNKPDALPPDIWHRFDFRLRIPPLRARIEQIPPLAKQLFADACKELEKTSLRLTGDELQTLEKSGYRWPGNVRQLQKAIKNAVWFHCGERNLTADEILQAAQRVVSRAVPASPWH